MNIRNKSEKDPDTYLKPTFTIESDHEKIVRAAHDLTRGCKSNDEKAVRLFYFVRDSIAYNLYMISLFVEDYKASRVLEWKEGNCVQKAVLFTSLARAAGIPSRLVFAMIRNHRVPDHVYKKIGTNIFYRHGYNQFFLSGRWVSVAATFDKHTCNKNGVPVVEFDGKNDATLPEKDLKGMPCIEYIEKFPAFDDLPFEWIYETIADKTTAVLGPDKRPWRGKDLKRILNSLIISI
ncbi:Transglutaminase-like protein [uncultured Desulfobacterium sp.]|uniref:Transglutaminase-like protein n=1 Tax=uncultured Desulfobacterium sp. TaxID=201089 RepID=A0A445N0S4_9BACT|nr:Transglutaminase-like protein [uncultured Desulfobacterium sp.]